MTEKRSAYEIHPPQTIVREEGGKSAEYTEPVWIKLSVAFRDGILKKLKGARLAVFICVALHMNAEGKSRPPQWLICKETGYSERAVRDSIRWLEANSILSIDPSKLIPGIGRTANEYTIKAFAAFGDKSPTTEILPDSANGRSQESEHLEEAKGEDAVNPYAAVSYGIEKVNHRESAAQVDPALKETQLEVESGGTPLNSKNSQISKAEKALLDAGVYPRSATLLMRDYSEEVILEKAKHWEGGALVDAIRENWTYRPPRKKGKQIQAKAVCSNGHRNTYWCTEECVPGEYIDFADSEPNVAPASERGGKQTVGEALGVSQPGEDRAAS